MNWDILDFVVFGAMVTGAVLGYRFLARKTASGVFRLAAGVTLGTAFLLLWVNGAVGLIGNENNPANLMIFGVLLVGAIGALVARFRAEGMARALAATAAAQALMAAIAIIGDLGGEAQMRPIDIIVIIGLFTGLWLIAAWLFHRAARGHPTLDAQA